MMENKLEAEIIQLTRQLEEKKKLLAGSQDVGKEDHELVRDFVSKEVYGPQTPVVVNNDNSQSPVVPKPAPTKPKKVKDYLDTLDRESAARINDLIHLAGDKGLKTALDEARNSDPFILDAFHDALVGKLYHELKDRGLVQ